MFNLNCSKIARIKLIVIEFFVAVTAIVGGIALIYTNGLGMYASSVQPIFYSYKIPGLILTFIVGGTHLFAAFAVLKNKSYFAEAAATAGFGLLIWIFFEIYITNLPHVLQVVYFALGIAELINVMYILKKK